MRCSRVSYRALRQVDCQTGSMPNSLPDVGLLMTSGLSLEYVLETWQYVGPIHHSSLFPGMVFASRHVIGTNSRFDADCRLTVTEVRWIFFKEHRHQRDEGPWVFRVPLV